MLHTVQNEIGIFGVRITNCLLREKCFPNSLHRLGYIKLLIFNYLIWIQFFEPRTCNNGFSGKLLLVTAFHSRTSCFFFWTLRIHYWMPATRKYEHRNSKMDVGNLHHQVTCDVDTFRPVFDSAFRHYFRFFLCSGPLWSDVSRIFANGEDAKSKRQLRPLVVVQVREEDTSWIRILVAERYRTSVRASVSVGALRNM